MANNRAAVEKAMDAFDAKYGLKHPKATECLLKVREPLLTFYDFLAEHGPHLETTNPIESVFATVKHQTARSKGRLPHGTAITMIFKLIMAAAKTWRRLKGANQLPKVVQGAKFRDGLEGQTDANFSAA